MFLLGYICSFVPILIDKIYETNLKFEFEFEYLFGILYIFGYLHLSYFVFAWAYSTILLAEYKFMTRRV